MTGLLVARCLAVALLSLTLGSACSSRASDDIGALGAPGELGTACLPIEVGERATIGIEALQNSADHAISIDRVELREPIGLSIIESRLLPIRDNTLIGLQPTYPPKPAMAVWDRSFIAAGYEMAAGQSLNLVMGVRVDDGGASAAGIDVSYEEDGQRRVYRTSTGLRFETAPGLCG